MKKRIAILDDYQGGASSLAYWERLRGRAAVNVFRDTLQGEDALARRLGPYEVLVLIRERTRFPSSLLERLPRLELLALTGRNSGHVDVATATARGVLVTETEGSGSAAIEHTIGLLVALVRRIPQEDRAMREGRWQTGLGVELAGKTLGILGLGRIGSRIAAFGKFLGMRVLAWGPTLIEPLPRNHPFLALENIVVSPHMGNVTGEAYHHFFRQVVESIEHHLDGRLPPRTLNPEAQAIRTH